MRLHTAFRGQRRVGVQVPESGTPAPVNTRPGDRVSAERATPGPRAPRHGELPEQDASPQLLDEGAHGCNYGRQRLDPR